MFSIMLELFLQIAALRESQLILYPFLFRLYLGVRKQKKGLVFLLAFFDILMMMQEQYLATSRAALSVFSSKISLLFYVAFRR